MGLQGCPSGGSICTRAPRTIVTPLLFILSGCSADPLSVYRSRTLSLPGAHLPSFGNHANASHGIHLLSLLCPIHCILVFLRITSIVSILSYLLVADFVSACDSQCVMCTSNRFIFTTVIFQVSAPCCSVGKTGVLFNHNLFQCSVFCSSKYSRVFQTQNLPFQFLQFSLLPMSVTVLPKSQKCSTFSVLFPPAHTVMSLLT